MRILGHRGASADAAENTLPAFEEAVRQGADGVELDVMLCGSGEVVVCHDDRLRRLAGVDWPVAGTALWKLRTLDIGRHLGFASATVPTLEEVFEVLPSDKLINIELKHDGFDDHGLVAAVVHCLKQAGERERILVSSFNPACLLLLGKIDGSFRRGFLIDPGKPFFVQDAVSVPLCANHSVHPHSTDCSDARMRAWQERGLSVAAWTVDEPAEARRLRSLGASYCITNRPAMLRRALEAGSG